MDNADNPDIQDIDAELAAAAAEFENAALSALERFEFIENAIMEALVCLHGGDVSSAKAGLLGSGVADLLEFIDSKVEKDDEGRINAVELLNTVLLASWRLSCGVITAVKRDVTPGDPGSDTIYV